MDAAHSPISRRRSPPHVVFLVDTQLTENSNLSYEQQAIDIRFGILRVLLYFYTCIDRRMTWGYQFFDSENSSSTLRLQNHFQELSISALDAFFNAFTSELEISVSKQRDKLSSTPDDESPFARLKQALAQALSDFQWKDIDIAYLASPGRLRRTPRSMRQMRNGPLETRNHIYVISSIPQTYSDLMWYFHGRSETAVQTHLTREGDKMKIVKLMDNAAMEMRKTLWDGFIDHRIALNWMDLRSNQIEDLSGEGEDIQLFIGTSFQAIAKIFGGYLIPFSLLQQDRAERYGYSIQSILCHYTSKTIDTSSQFARNRKGTGNITKPSLYDITQGIQAVRNVAWTGDLILNEELLTQGVSKINLLVHNLLRPQLSNALIEMAGSEKDSVVSMEKRLQNITSMKGFLLLPAAYIPVKWQLSDSDKTAIPTGINEHFLCTFNHNGDRRALSEFETLISTMNQSNQVLIVRLEFQDIKMEGFEYAVIQPLAHLCATIGFLKCQTEELLALTRFDQAIETETGDDGHGTTMFDPWVSTGLEFFGDEVDESLVLFSIDTHMPAELKSAIAIEAASQSAMDATLTIDSLSLATNENEMDGMDLPEILDRVIEINDKPASLEEFQSYWIEMYLPFLYQTSIEPDIIAGRLQTWVNYLEHSVKITPTDILNALKLLPMSFHSFDAKHKEISNASGIITDELAPHLVDDEVDFLQNWKQTRQLDSKSLRILKIKDAQLQIVVMLKIMELEKRFMTLNKIELPKPQKRKTKKKKAQGKEDLDQQLELYFERLCIWDSMMDTSQSANDATTPKLLQKGTDDIILHLRSLCKCLSDIYRPILPDTIDKLWSRCGGEEELLTFETGRMASSGSATKAALSAEKITKSNKKLPMDVDARVKLLESRIRGPSTETAVTDAAWATKSDSKSVPKQMPTSSNINLLSGSRKAPSSTINLPFMKREIEMTKSLSSSSKTKSKPSNMSSTQSKASGSRRKITTPKKIPMAIMDGRNTETVVLRKRTALSPTTPRTRAERDFGLRLARTPTKSPSFVPMTAKRSTDGIDGPVISSPRKLMRTLTGSRSPTAQRHRTSLPISRIRLSPSSPSHNRIKQTKPADLTEIAPKRDLFTSFLQASAHSNDKDEA
ncbi:hypothetical protein K450DRAFT_216718 [Umbelopsis ramanniana AG]|uniref:DNA replication regulator Sld3 C-terminal domain-containing protein n=1 Tax=Umbelopsis ramanniana AG TaxID=1314678 RepID=A0AAD5ELF0_UMBRA|nr:uncharacterized protein K450DRAFT_216718 [Umbelopsis ramanniana AG]KAI8584515.1 hypothetical protein K450DRAFT_216718 [Umbelopsis ramanniana AG]